MPDLSAFIFYTVAAPLFFAALGWLTDLPCPTKELKEDDRG